MMKLCEGQESDRLGLYKSHVTAAKGKQAIASSRSRVFDRPTLYSSLQELQRH